MGKGRPKGSKNRPGHNGGGDRRSKDFLAARQEQQRRKDEFFIPNEKTKKKVQLPKFTEHPLSEKNFEAAREKLDRVLDDPSMPKGGKNIPTRGIIDKRSDNWDVSYDDTPSTERDCNVNYRRSYMPPTGTPLKIYLDKVATAIHENDAFK